MGHQATLVINMDLVDQIKDDTQFGKKVYEACCSVTGRGKPVAISNVAQVVACHHADWYSPMIVGNLGAIVCSAGTSWQRNDSEEDIKLRTLKSLAEEMGYGVSKKPSPKKK